MKKRVFIDGEAGTTGLQIRDRLAALASKIDVLSIDPAKRKDAGARRALMQAADAIVLCLPDDAAIEAVALAKSLGSDAPKIVDASTAHRVSPDWVYGFAELNAAQANKIASSHDISNPGCYPTGAIALLRPLISRGLLPPDTPISINAVSGYSGGGKSMIESYEKTKTAPNFELYGLGLEHKHVPEIQKYAGLTTRPLFVPSVGNFKQGMLVSIPLHLATLPGKPKIADIQAALAEHFTESKLVHVDDNAAAQSRLEPQALNNSDMLELFVFGKDTLGHALLVARLDNLGKGAAGAAVQNLQITLGLSVS
jgi:N-acetyl-gamma-glutamyl-phosphate reductase